MCGFTLLADWLGILPCSRPHVLRLAPLAAGAPAIKEARAVGVGNMAEHREWEPVLVDDADVDRSGAVAVIDAARGAYANSRGGGGSSSAASRAGGSHRNRFNKWSQAMPDNDLAGSDRGILSNGCNAGDRWADAVVIAAEGWPSDCFQAGDDTHSKWVRDGSSGVKAASPLRAAPAGR